MINYITGIIIDSNLKWKQHVNYLTNKIKKNIGLLSKIRYFVNQSTLVSLYYALIYPYFTYSLLTWGHTYDTIFWPIILLQKRALRIIMFSSYCDHSSPLLKSLNLIKLQDLVKILTAVLMFKFHNSLAFYL